MNIRKIQTNDAQRFFNLLSKLDRQTKTMMYEPDERPNDLSMVNAMIVQSDAGNALVLVAEENDDIIGFLSAQKGRTNRIKHTAYIVTGILSEYHNKKIGTNLFSQLYNWAMQNEIKRLELTVVCSNSAAVHLYKKSGFKIEGVKQMAMLIDGEYTDEYYMSKLL